MSVPRVGTQLESRLRSLDAWVMSSPRQAFGYMASRPSTTGMWPAVRRPLLVAAVLGCGVSMLSAGSLTARIALSATVYWAFVPLAEVIALVVVTRRRLGHRSLGHTIDIFFAGHGPWTLLLIGLSAALTLSSPATRWQLLTGAALWATVLVVLWSAYIDFWFFRQVMGAGRRGAIRDVVVHRLMTWAAVIVIFAVPVVTPGAILEEVAGVVTEWLRQ
jgi:hypothetical protein